MKKFNLVSLINLLCFLTCCTHREYHDPCLKLKEKDYKDIINPLPYTPPSVPQPSPQRTPQKPPLHKNMLHKVSVALNESLLLKDILNTLSQQAGVGIALSKDLTEKKLGIFYRANNQPLIHVLEDICRLENYRLNIKGNLFQIEPDTPYLLTYDLQFLSQIRKSENRISVSTDLFTSVDNTYHKADNGSESILTNQTSSDFWSELEHNLKTILTHDAIPSPQEKTTPYFSIHKQGGLVNIFASQKQHQHVSEYLRRLWDNIGTQILIEAKIIEVTLFDEFRSGINWNQLGSHFFVSSPFGSMVKPALKSPIIPQRDVFTFAFHDHDFSTSLNLIKKFGTVRTLSNPRLTVMNNQPAMLKVATNEVFFHLEFERLLQSDGKPDIETLSSDVYTIPIGLVLIVQPSANASTGDITMTLRPTVSRVDKEIEDPAVAIRSQQTVKSTVPVVQVREIDSVLKIKSGQVLVMGGLMEDRSTNTSSSLPTISDLPLVGELVRGKDDERKTTELVIFLTAHIIHDPLIKPADTKTYKTFTSDPRPLPL